MPTAPMDTRDGSEQLSEHERHWRVQPTVGMSGRWTLFDVQRRGVASTQTTGITGLTTQDLRLLRDLLDGVLAAETDDV